MSIKIFRLILVVVTFALTACSDSMEFENEILPGSPGTITIYIRNSNNTRSKESDDSENKIDNIVIGMYLETDDDSSPATLWKVYKNLKKSGAATIPVPISPEIENLLFAKTDGAKCRLFILANLEDPDGVPEKASINQLKQYEITSHFNSEKVQPDFIMTGESIVEYTASAISSVQGSAEGECTLYRAAAKICLNLNLPESVEIKDAAGNVTEKWYPVTDENAISVLINNGVKSAVASPVPDQDNTPWQPQQSDAYYNSSLSSDRSYRTLSLTDNQEFPYRMDVPFYTYPNAWTESVEEKTKTTLTLIVPWRKTTDTNDQYTVFYYQVPVTPAELPRIDRNYSYIINLNVNMLGSTVPEAPFDLDNLSYQVVNWGREDIDITIPDYRYLVVNPNVYTVNNESTITIPFYTSHPAEISDITMTYQRFNYPSNNTGGVIEIPISKDIIDISTRTTVGETQKICDYAIVEDPVSKKQTIQIKHPMIMWIPVRANGSEVSLQRVGSVDNLQQTIDEIVKYVYPTDYHASLTPEMAYFPYKFSITIRHIDDHTRFETIEITQYPGMYIINDLNPGGTYLAYDVTKYIVDLNPQDNIDYGFVFLNPEAVDYNGQIAWKNASQQLFPNEFTDQNKRPTDDDFLDEYVSKGLGGIREYKAPDNTPDNVNNYNMYVINITQLSSSDVDQDGESYIIGDPRTKFVNNNLVGNSLAEDTADASDKWCHEANALYDGSSKRRLRYYHPTDETNATRMMVAPRLRISSIYGYVQSQKWICDKRIGRRRAATYQEQGYPAGRWRLPTYAEVSFICRLSAQGKIPVLFNIGEKYMTAQGVYEINSNGTLTPSSISFSGIRWSTVTRAWSFTPPYGECNLRPVYDEWYWENEPDYQLKKGQDGGYIYTLGDMPLKSN